MKENAMDEFRVKLRSGNDEQEVLMSHSPRLRQEILRQGRIWRVVAVSFLLTKRAA